MRYTTPTHPVYRLAGYHSQTTGPYPGSYPHFELVGYAPGVAVPNPGSPPPKHGHWRITPNARPKCHRTGTRNATPMWKSTLPTANTAEPNAGLRARVRAAVASGAIAPADAPSWAQPR